MLPIGYRIAFFRRQRGLTQADLARRSGIPQPNLSRIERGEQDLTVSTLVRICSSLGTSPVKIFEERRSGESVCWTRSALERVARAVVGSAERLTGGEKKIAELFKDEIHGLRKRLPLKRVYQSWCELRQRLSREEIRALIERIADAQRRHA